MYQDLLHELGFKPIKTSTKDGVYFGIGILNLRDVIIKIVPKTEVAKVHGFYKEALVDDILEQNNRDLSKPLIVKARVLSVGQNEKNAWIIRRYYPGRSLSITKNEKLLLAERLSTIEGIYLLKYDILKKIIENITSFQSLSINFRRSGIRKDSFSRRFGDSLDIIAKAKIEAGLGFDLSEHYAIFENKFKKYFNKSNIVACTGDLTPANIILKKDGQIIFSDFEWFCLDNYTVDIAFFWLFLYRHPRWQKYLISELITNDEARINFQISIIRILLYWLKSVFDADQPSDESLDRRKRYKRHIWTRYLEASGESFEALMKVK